MKYFAYALLCIAVPLMCIAFGKAAYDQKRVVTEVLPYYQQSLADIPIATVNPVEETVDVSADSYIVLDVDSGVVLAEKNADILYFPASTAKMMTALVARELYQSELVATVPFGVLGLGEHVLFPMGAQFTVRDLITAALIQSNNAAALTLARIDPLGVPHFVSMMNKKAEDLHLTRTRFDNPVGFDSEYMQSTARELAFLAKELIQDTEFRETVSTKQTTITDIKTRRQYTLYNTNELLGFNNQVYGVKTGTTDLAGQVLVSLVRVDRHEVIIVVLDSADRYADTKALLHWLNTQVQWYTIDELVLDTN